ncbi:MAG: TolC family protein, partial [Alphaproteobacteria bacterium]
MNKYLAFFSFALLASCSVGPDYRQPQFFGNDEIAKSLGLNGQNSRQITKDWYRRFNDEALNVLIDNALENSPDVQIAVQKLRQARANLKINAVSYLPSLNADGGYHYSKSSKNIGAAINTDYYQAGLDASWEIDIWGAGRRQTEEYQALYRAAGANLDNVRISLAAETANNYINLRMAQEQLEIANKNLRLQQDIFETVKEKHAAGLADDIALNQSQYAVENTKTIIPAL